jgi:hypothetical protein
MVGMGRITTVLLMILAGTFALTIMDNATQAFNILLLSGAGSGAIYLLRWFWWRINAYSEITAMIVATVMAVVLVLFVDDATMASGLLDGFTVKLLLTVSVVSVAWLSVTFLTKPEDEKTLRNFYRLTKPGGPGWKKVVEKAIKDNDKIDDGGAEWQMPRQLLLVFIGCVTIYSSLFCIGGIVYGNTIQASILGAVALVGTFALFKILKGLRLN